MSDPDETYRGTTQARTPDNAITTVVVTRQGLGQGARIWLTTGATTLSTIVLTDEQAEALGALWTRRGPRAAENAPERHGEATNGPGPE